MATDKKRIATYVTEETVKKFKIVSATKDKSMSEYTEILIKKAIEEYEYNNGEIKTEKNINIENSKGIIVGDNGTINM